MVTIILERSNELKNHLRNYAVYIDGRKVGSIADGTTEQYEVAAGEHTICCKIDWCSSPEIKFNTNNDLVKNFKVTANKKERWLSYLLIALTIGMVFLKQAGVSYYAVLAIFILLSLAGLYYITIGRKKYLALSEV